MELSQASARARTRLLRIAALVILALSGIVASFAMIAPSRAPDFPTQGLIREPFAVSTEPANTTGEAPLYVRSERFNRGDTLPALLRRLGIPHDEAQPLAQLRALRLLRTGTQVYGWFDDQQRLKKLSFLARKQGEIVIQAAEKGFLVLEDQPALETVPVYKTGVIRSSLFAAADVSDIPDSIAIQMAEIFSGDIDFHRDLRVGDRFSVVYEEIRHRGGAVASGRVLATEFVNQRKPLRAIYYEPADGKGGYYAPDGSSLRKAFLRSPLEFSRVSSTFGNRRHPILKTWRAHKGVDYAAPTGTRVRAVGDGRVDFAGRKGGYGNVVIVRHRNNVSTLYAHLNRIGRGIRRGTRVDQGDTVGTVGSTGWATGPHLHYEFRVSDVARNPLAIVLPAAPPIAPRERTAYMQHAAPFVEQIELLARTDLASVR